MNPYPFEGETEEEAVERNIRNQEWKLDVAREDVVLDRVLENQESEP